MLGAIMTKSKEILLVMEYLEHGSLYDFLRNDKLPTPDMFLLPIVKDIVSGMRYIHNLRPAVIHGDLKAKNVLVDGNFKAKITDFGLSQKRRFGCGTPLWMAPGLFLVREVCESTCACLSLCVSVSMCVSISLSFTACVDVARALLISTTSLLILPLPSPQHNPHRGAARWRGDQGGRRVQLRHHRVRDL